jgi:hypothetical protein
VQITNWARRTFSFPVNDELNVTYWQEGLSRLESWKQGRLTKVKKKEMKRKEKAYRLKPYLFMVLGSLYHILAYSSLGVL